MAGQVTPVQIAKTITTGTVSITTFDSNHQIVALGSGFVTSKNVIATNLHVLDRANSCAITLNKSTIEIECLGWLAKDEMNDLILLKFPDLKTEPLLDAEPILPEIGSEVFVMGNPKGLDGTFSNGLVSGHRNFDECERIQISDPISPGSSGGPVVGKNSKVIGIAFASYSQGQNLNFVIPIKYLSNLKSQLSNLPASLTELKHSSKPEEKTEWLNPLHFKNFEYHFHSKTAKGFINIKDGEAVNIEEINKLNSSNVADEIFLNLYSIKNNTALKLCDIELLFIIYDRKNEPSDSFRSKECSCSFNWIEPYLAHEVRVPSQLIDGLKGGLTIEIRFMTAKTIN